MEETTETPHEGWLNLKSHRNNRKDFALDCCHMWFFQQRLQCKNIIYRVAQVHVADITAAATVMINTAYETDSFFLICLRID